MKRFFKFIGSILGLLIVGVVIIAALNWTTITNFRRTTEAGVKDVEIFQPRTIVAGCEAPPLDSFGADTPLPADAFAEMKAYSDGFGGVGLMVLIDGKIAAEAYSGDADQTTKTFSYSMHKSVMGLLYGAAIADGVIGSIDDPIGQYLPGWADDPRGQIPLRAFLTMSSGLESPGFTTLRGLRVNFSSGVTKAALTSPVQSAPLETFEYKGVDSQLAGAALNAALIKAGKGPYRRYLSEKIWCPIGASDASLFPENPEGDPRFYAYLDATLRDWARVGLMVLGNGAFAGEQLIPAEWVSEATASSKTNPIYGLQIWRGTPYVAERAYSTTSPLRVPQKEPFLAEDVIYFDGFGGQRVYVVPSANMVIVRTGEPTYAWEESTLVNTALRALETPEGAR
ncbi:MAG: serine hydrolase [Pseudomonadota bacterium]